MSSMDAGQYWDEWERVAARDDAKHRAERTPMLSDLVKAARRTTLYRLFPFTSHGMLRFGSVPAWDDGPIAPVFVVLSPTEGYLVCRGHPYRTEAQPVVATLRADEAASAIERLLTDWHEPTPEN